MGYKSITQIVLFITSLVIVFTYIQPAFLTIKDTQDELFEYSDASNKASELNTQLSQLLSVEKSFSKSDLVALEEYLPSTVDNMAVMSDITTMAELNGAQITEMTSGLLIPPGGDVVLAGQSIKAEGTSYVDFTLTVEATYEAFKSMLLSLEQNKYPLEVISLEFGEAGVAQGEVSTSIDEASEMYDMVLRTYSYSSVTN